MHISFSYAKVLGETNFQPREFPRSGSKAKDGEKEKERRLKVGNNNGQLRIANANSGGACKAAWANISEDSIISFRAQKYFAWL